MQLSLRLKILSLLLARLLCSLPVVWVMPVHAGVVAGLYDVVEAVPSRDISDRTAATSRALERVFVRVTGDEEIGKNPLLLPMLKQGQNYVQVYRYESEDGQLYVKFSFDPQAISGLVNKLRLPLWPNNRPSTLVWMAVDSLQGGRATLHQEEQPELFELLDSLAMERGLPVDFPLMDLNDQRTMPLVSLWAQDEAAAQRAGVRYGPDASLMGRLLQTSAQRWQANWLLIHGGRSYGFDASGSTLEEVALGGINEAANYLAQRYGVLAGESGVQSAIRVELSGVANFADYLAATRYLRELAQVSGANVIEISADRIIVLLSTSTQVSSLRETLALNRQMLPVQREEDLINLSGYRAPPGSTQNPLRYRWR